MVFGSHPNRPAPRVNLPARQPSAGYSNLIVLLAQRRRSPTIIRNNGDDMADKREHLPPKDRFRTGAEESAICSKRARPNGVPERAAFRAARAAPNPGMGDIPLAISPGTLAERIIRTVHYSLSQTRRAS